MYSLKTLFLFYHIIIISQYGLSIINKQLRCQYIKLLNFEKIKCAIMIRIENNIKKSRGGDSLCTPRR